MRQRFFSALCALLGSGCGVGFLPWMPGTWGSLLGLALWWLFIKELPYQWLLIVGAILVAVFVAQFEAIRHQQRDPSVIVIDEIVGIWCVLWFLPQQSTWWYAIAFALFRFFDIAKPLPVAMLERLPGGWGIVLDDIAAGLLAGFCMMGLKEIFSGF